MEARRAEMEQARRLAAPRAQGATEQQLRVEAAQQQLRVEAARERRVEMEQARRLAAPRVEFLEQQIEERVEAARERRIAQQTERQHLRRAAQSRLTEALLVEHQRLQAQRQEERERARERRTSESEGNRFEQRIITAVGEDLWNEAQAEGTALAQQLLHVQPATEGHGSPRAGRATRQELLSPGRNSRNRDLDAAWRDADELSFFAARHDLVHAAIVIASSGPPEAFGTVERLANGLLSAPNAALALVCFRPLLFVICRNYVEWVAHGTDRTYPTHFDVHPQGGQWRYAIGFHTRSGPGRGLSYILSLARPSPRLVWFAITLLASLNAWDASFGGAGESHAMLNRLLESMEHNAAVESRTGSRALAYGERRGFHSFVAEAVFRALARNGDTVLNQNERVLLQAAVPHSVGRSGSLWRYVTDPRLRREYEELAERPRRQREAARAAQDEAEEARRQRSLQARGLLRVPGLPILAQLSLSGELSPRPRLQQTAVMV